MPGMSGFVDAAFGNVSENDWSGLRVQARPRQWFTTGLLSAFSATATPLLSGTGYSRIVGAWSGLQAASANGVQVQQYFSGMTATAVYETLFGGAPTGAFSIELVADYVRARYVNGATAESGIIFGGHLRVI